MLMLLLAVPTLVTLGLLRYHPASRVMLYVYLPVLMLLPMYLTFWVGAQAISGAFAIGIVLAIAGFAKERHNLRVSPVDVCVVASLFCVFYADARHRPIMVAIYALTNAFATTLCPYIIGRTLIEQSGSRQRFAKRFVILLAVVAVFSLWEFFTVRNPFQEVTQTLMRQQSAWIRQTRWGFGRVAGPFGHAITAGMVFTIGFIFQLWLIFTRAWKKLKPNGTQTGSKSTLLVVAMVLGLAIALSRGPWIGCSFGLIVATVGFAKDRKRAAVIAVFALTIGLIGTSAVLDSYTAPDDSTYDVDQQNAVYRRELFATYSPLIQQGGFWGWGSPLRLATGEFAYAVHQTSIDNEYIRDAMAQGYAGVTLFIAMLSLTIYKLVRWCVRFQKRDDIVFAYTMLGIVVAIAFTLSTVFLGEPMLELLYLVFGWSQSLQPSRTTEAEPTVLTARPYIFKRIFI